MSYSSKNLKWLPGKITFCAQWTQKTLQNTAICSKAVFFLLCKIIWTPRCVFLKEEAPAEERAKGMANKNEEMAAIKKDENYCDFIEMDGPHEGIQ